MISTLPSWNTRTSIAFALIAAGVGTVYWFHDSAMQPLGLGTVPMAIWVISILWALSFHRSWLYRYNLWIGSLVLAVLIMGILAFYQPYSGPLSWFTLDGEITLGGTIGESMIGPNVFWGSLRLLGICAAGLALTLPSLTVKVFISIGKSVVYIYVISVVVAREVLRIFHLRRGGQIHQPYTDESNISPEVMSPYPHAREIRGNESETENDNGLTLEDPQLDDSLKITAQIPKASNDLTESPNSHSAKTSAILNYESKETDSSPPVTSKFNKFWASTEFNQAKDDHANKENFGEKIADKHESDHKATVTQKWILPTTEILLEGPTGGITKQELNKTAETIRQTLSEYGIEVEIGQVRPGPTVTMYGLIPGWVRRYKQVKATDETGRPKLDESGKVIVTREETKTRVKVDSILSREKDLALALKTPSIRIDTPVMGKSQVGIEIPNPNPNLVTLRSVMESKEFGKLRNKASLPIALGKGSDGESVVIDLAKMPHLLIAGATGSGKSVCINTIVSCLIMQKTPADLRLLLIDPKRVELTPYNGIPHLLTPVVVETDQTVGFLKGMIKEMLDRYRQFEDLGVRNIEAYNKKMTEKMPFLVVGIDELADLMMSASFDVEQSLCRLAQLGRATGIHLIVATQRPSVDVVTGLIKANFPSRVSFGVSSHVDSRTILDSVGAEKLLGRGDMLYLPLDASLPVRAQNVFISDREIEELVSYWKNTPQGALANIHLQTSEDTPDVENHGQTNDDEPQDELLGDAVELAHSYSKLSTSLLQRRLRIGYPRAARLMDELEEQGIVGPSDGSKSRDVIISGT